MKTGRLIRHHVAFPAAQENVLQMGKNGVVYGLSNKDGMVSRAEEERPRQYSIELYAPASM